MGTSRTGLGAAFHLTTCLRGVAALTSPETTETGGEQELEATSMQVASMEETLSHRHESVWEGRVHAPS
jgi:hypothetical protein